MTVSRARIDSGPLAGSVIPPRLARDGRVGVGGERGLGAPVPRQKCRQAALGPLSSVGGRGGCGRPGRQPPGAGGPLWGGPPRPVGVARRFRYRPAFRGGPGFDVKKFGCAPGASGPPPILVPPLPARGRGAGGGRGRKELAPSLPTQCWWASHRLSS
jgi:hypothetical protein